VVSQSSDSGNLFRGDRVELVVSKGPVMVEVPEVRRMTTGKATATLEALGFSVQTARVEYYIGLGLVVKQSPSSGGRAPQGSTITIYIV
jgi:eukaryotic-like serine/threonine-protein kinase